MKGQSWSMDLVIAVVIFGFMAVTFYSLIVLQDKPSVDELRQEAETVNTKLEQPVGACGSIIEGQAVTAEKLQCLYGMNYTELRQQFNIKGSFCIYIEDTNGKLYIVSADDGGNKTGVGDPNLIVSGTPCGQNITG